MITFKTGVSLADLPRPTVISRSGRLPWSLVNTRELAEILGADPCQISMWIYRGKGPPSLPTSWFKNRVRAFRLSAVTEWLARRNGAADLEWRQWQRFLTEHLIGDQALSFDEAAIRAKSSEVIRLLGEKAFCPAGTHWRRHGFSAYVQSVAQV